MRDGTARGAEVPVRNRSGRACTTTGHVSVVVIAYNDAEHLPDAVRSALDQGDAVGEVIVVDDCSTDGTAAVLAELAAADPRVGRCPADQQRRLRHPPQRRRPRRRPPRT